MKIVYFICSNISLPGGTERALSTTIKLLNSVDDIKLVVISLSTSMNDAPYFKVDADIIHCSLKPLRKSLMGKLSWYKKTIQILNPIFQDSTYADVIFSYGHNVSLILPFISTKARRYACEHINFYSIPKVSRLCMQLCYHYLDGVIALSKTAKEKLKKLNKAIYIIPNSIPFDVNDISIEKEKTIIMVGRISPEKGYDRVVAIAKELRNRLPQWKIEIWGDGPDFYLIKELYKKEGIDDFVTLKGSTKNIVSVYQKASLLIMTSYTEALPMVIIEANAYGIPVVAYECEGTIELISEGVNGYVIEDNNYMQFTDKILQVISDDNIYKSFFNSSCKTSKKFSNDEIRKKWVELISI